MKLKIMLTSIATAISLSVSGAAYSQQVDPGLADACQGDIDLTEYVVQFAKSPEAENDSEFFSAEELDQIQTVLTDESLNDASVKEKLGAVMQACSEGRILLDRFDAFLSVQ